MVDLMDTSHVALEQVNKLHEMSVAHFDGVLCVILDVHSLIRFQQEQRNTGVSSDSNSSDSG